VVALGLVAARNIHDLSVHPALLAFLFGGEEAKLHPPTPKDDSVGSALAETATLGLKTVGGLETVARVLENISEHKQGFLRSSIKTPTSGKHHFNHGP
jgi:hypothetical protein